MSCTVLRNATFFTGDSIIDDRALLIDGWRIVGFIDLDKAPSDATTIDLDGCRVCPGFIDLQVNGSGVFNASLISTRDEMESLGAELARTGTTRWAPTILSRGMDIVRSIADIVRAVGESSGVIALHLEGPWLNPDRAGAHVLSRLRAPTAEDIDEVLRIAGDMTTIVTVAPECLPDDLLRRLTNHPGIRVMLAHSTADFDATARFLDAGGAGITHIMNTIAGIASRAPGPVPALTSRPDKYASVIADGVHLHPATVALLHRAMARGSLYLVSDVIWDDFLASSARDGILAGSRMSLREMVAYCVQTVGLPLDEALRMATLYPARFLGLGDRFGRLAPGHVADIVALDADFSVHTVIRNGQRWR